MEVAVSPVLSGKESGDNGGESLDRESQSSEETTRIEVPASNEEASSNDKPAKPANNEGTAYNEGPSNEEPASSEEPINHEELINNEELINTGKEFVDSDKLVTEADTEKILEEQIQFRCKLCQYTGNDKEEIASHFLSEHIAVEVRSVGKDDLGSPVKGGFVAVTNSSKPTGKKRGRPRKGTKEKDEVTVDDDDDDEDEGKVFVHKPNQVSISSRGRRRKIPFKFAVDADDDGSYPYLSARPRRGRGSKRGKGNKKGKLKVEDAAFYKRHSLTVTPAKFEEKLENLVQEWERAWFLQKSSEDVKCKYPGCSCQLDEEEMMLHLKCHKPFLEGFQCPSCVFVCVHWRNMRHHFYKEHEQKSKSLSCDFENCESVFERFGELRRHVCSTHLKAQLAAKLSQKNVENTTTKGSDEIKKETLVSVKQTDDPPLDIKDVEKEKVGNSDEGTNENHQTENKGANSVEPSEEEELEVVKNSSKSDVIVVVGENLGFEVERKGEVESTRKRITKKRRSAPEMIEDQERAGNAKKKRHYVKSQEFDGNMIDRQRALVAYTCDLCGSKFNDPADLEKHRSLHSVEDEEDGTTFLKCTECPTKFSSSNLLEEHVKQNHKRLLKLHRCHLCQFSSDRRFDLKKHLVIHTGVKNFMCDQCGKCMSTPYNLKIHYLRLHATEEEKTISCRELNCKFKCADKAVLKDHLRQKHNLMLDNKNLDKFEKIKLFSCKHCNYTGKKESSLRYHMRIHLENRQHKCKLCPYASKTKNNLILHMRTHDGMQPVKCLQCDFRGATNKIISEHILSKHAGIRPYRCLVCKWTTSYSGNMWKHIHDHRRELGDSMPEEPVEVVTSEGVSIPVPLRPPSGRKRSKALSSQFEGKSASENLKAISKVLQASRSAQNLNVGSIPQLIRMSTTGSNPEETVTIVEVPLPLGDDENRMVIEGGDNVNSTMSTLNSLAAAVATAREVALLSQQAQAVMTGQQHPDAGNPYPVSQLFQQIAGHATNSQQAHIIGSALSSSSSNNEVIITVTSPDSLHEAVMQSGISSTAVVGTQTDQTKVTYTIAQPQGRVEEVQFEVQPNIQFENPASVSELNDSHVDGGHVLVNIDDTDLQIAEGEAQGQALQIIQGDSAKEQHPDTGEQSGEADSHNVQQLVSMIPEAELVMSMVQAASHNDTNPTVSYSGENQQPVEAHIVVADPENPDQFIQQEIHYVQANEDGSAILQQNGNAQVVHIVRQENGELAYQDANGQVYTAHEAQVMFHSDDQTHQDFIPNQIPEAISMSDSDTPLEIDSGQLSGAEGPLTEKSAEGDTIDHQLEVEVTVPAELMNQDQGELDESEDQEENGDYHIVEMIDKGKDQFVSSTENPKDGVESTEKDNLD